MTLLALTLALHRCRVAQVLLPALVVPALLAPALAVLAAARQAFPLTVEVQFSAVAPRQPLALRFCLRRLAVALLACRRSHLLIDAVIITQIRLI